MLDQVIDLNGEFFDTVEFYPPKNAAAGDDEEF